MLGLRVLTGTGLCLEPKLIECKTASPRSKQLDHIHQSREGVMGIWDRLRDKRTR